MSKEITEELINARLEKLGFGEKQINDEDLVRKSVLDHYHVKLTDNFQDGDFNIYEESTADGYEVWVACPDTNGSENYEHVIYISDLNLNFIDEATQTLFAYLAEKFEEEVIDTLVDEGYEYKLEEQTNEN